MHGALAKIFLHYIRENKGKKNSKKKIETSVPENSLRIFFATAPAATLPMVSLAEDLPPPFNYIFN